DSGAPSRLSEATTAAELQFPPFIESKAARIAEAPQRSDPPISKVVVAAGRSQVAAIWLEHERCQNGEEVEAKYRRSGLVPPTISGHTAACAIVTASSSKLQTTF